jgi:hypothetical protein
VHPVVRQREVHLVTPPRSGGLPGNLATELAPAPLAQW